MPTPRRDPHVPCSAFGLTMLADVVGLIVAVTVLLFLFKFVMQAATLGLALVALWALWRATH